jgi:hypothetical protein
MTSKDRREFLAYCRGCTDSQLRNVQLKETLARRSFYATIAREVMAERGLT